METNQPFDQNTIVQCFIHIHDSNSSSLIRKQADTFLINCEKQLIPLIKVLMLIFQNDNNNYDVQIRLQALLYLANVIKRNWNQKQLKCDTNLAQIKKQVCSKLITYIQLGQKIFIHCLFDIVKFIVKIDYPHTFSEFSCYSLMLLSQINVSEQKIYYFKQLRDIFIELAERKGAVNIKNFEQGPLKILAMLRPITEAMRQQLSKNQDINTQVIKLSKYCDQIVLCLIRIAPFCYLDDLNFMGWMKVMMGKVQSLLSTHANQNNKNKEQLQKNIKSIVYQLGCLQQVNPCIMAEVMTEYISTLFYIISKPEIFIKPATLKYALLSTRKLLKQFTYYADETIFTKSSSSHPRSNNYFQLRNVAHKIYQQFMTEESVKKILDFLLTHVMNIKSKQDEGFVVGFQSNQQSVTEYEKSTEKDLSVHVCSTLLAQSLIQRFPQKMLQIIYLLLKTSINSNWCTMDTQTKINFLSIVSILPKSCKRNQLNYLSQFPIIDILQFVHSSQCLGIKEKFPGIVNGWMDIFSDEQIGQLVEVLLSYVEEGQKSNKMQIVLYSCYSLNKIVTLKNTSVDTAHILYKIFPIAITIFERTDSPQILWPLISLIATLLTKCQFDSNIIISCIQSKSLNSLISNQSQMLVQALCQMFKTFLCVISRNRPAIAVFKLVYHFLNRHLSNIHALSHEKCVTLWYYSIREFSVVNQCNSEYCELFETHFNKCLFNIKPILIYILQQYMLLQLIESKLDSFVQKIIEFYRQGEYIENSQKLNNVGGVSQKNQSLVQQGIQLKIAALSFQITLITKYNLQKVNSEQMLYIVIKDFCCNSDQTCLHSNIKVISNTLQNSLLSIVNRYIMINPSFFFNFLKSKMDITPPSFFGYYFKNMAYLTSRTALRINALALASLLTEVDSLFKPYDVGQVLPCIVGMLKIMIPQIEQYIRYLTGLQGTNAGKIENSPTHRFGHNILSERKEQIRKQGSYQEIDLKQYFLKQFQKCLQNIGIHLQIFVSLMNENDESENWGHRLTSICN